METVALSSSVIVPVPTAPVVMAAICVAVVFVTAPKVMVNCSLASTIESVAILTEIVCVSPTVPVKCSGLAVVTEKSPARRCRWR